MNVPTLIVLIIILIFVVFAMKSMVKNRNSSCGGNCGCCAKSCHYTNDFIQKNNKK